MFPVFAIVNHDYMRYTILNYSKTFKNNAQPALWIFSKI